MSNKYFYEKSRFSEFKSNTTYHQLLEMTDDEFVSWARLLRKEVTEQWDERGTPPVIGKNEEGIIKNFKKLKSNPAKYWEKDLSGDDLNKAYRAYAKHWGELKGFAMAMQSGKSNLGATATKMNDLMGFGPVTLNNTYVTGMDANGNFVMDRKRSWSDYQLHMLNIQQMMVDTFGVKSRVNDGLGDLQALSDKLDSASSAETD